MARMAVVGCEGSGKTVFMSALADYYRPSAECGVCLVPENSAANRFAAFQRRQMRALRQWPPATNPEKTVRLEWSLRRDGETLVEIGMLEFGGETFRAAFRGDGGEEAKASAVKDLLSYLSDADIVVVLVSIRDLMLDQGSLSTEEFERDAEALWVTRGILDFVSRERPSAGVVIGLTRADQYRAELDAAGGAAALFASRWPTVASASAKTPVVEVASVSAVDDAGMPAEGFKTDGILPAMCEVAKMRYGSINGILAELSALKADLGRPTECKTFASYSNLLRRYSGRFADLKATATIAGKDIARESKEIESSLERFRIEAKTMSAAARRRSMRRRHPLVRGRYIVALLFASALFAANRMLPIDRAIARLSECVDQRHDDAMSVPSPVKTNAPPAEVEVAALSVETNAPVETAAAEIDVAPVAVVETNAAAMVAVKAETEEGQSKSGPSLVVSAVPLPDLANKALVTFSNRLERAMAGDLKCKRWLGNQYYKGTDVVPRDLVAARRWYREAAEGGDARAQACMGAMCESGEGGPMLPSEAMSWYRKAAEGGVADAMFWLGVNLWEGAVDDPKAAQEAYDWMLKAKAAGCHNEDLDAWLRKAKPRDR